MRKVFDFLLISGPLTFALFVFLEGLTSVSKAGYDIYTIMSSGETFSQDEHGMAETTHGRYDSDLGWANIPDIRVDDMYGPGVHLATNSQGFRAESTFSVDVPPGKVRVICSGDSFTLGYGVSNQDAWCNYLSEIDPDIEAVNMGQGGYGLDQSYLWYKRDGVILDHHVQLFAIIWPDLGRMLSSQFLGYEKPMLAVDGAAVVVRNVPVPNNLTNRKSYLIAEEIRNLALAKGAKALRRLLSSDAAPEYKTAGADSVWSHDDRGHAYHLTKAILTDLASINADKQSRLIVIMLPIFEDREPEPISEEVRSHLRQLSAELGIGFLDLFDAYRGLGFAHQSLLFQYGQYGGHYSIEGNRFVSREILNYLDAAGIRSAGEFETQSRGGQDQ